MGEEKQTSSLHSAALQESVPRLADMRFAGGSVMAKEENVGKAEERAEQKGY